MEIPAVLKKKYGPLPVWGWGLVALAVVYGGIMLRNRNAANAVPFGGQAAKSNLGTSNAGNGGGSGSISFPDSLPNTQVEESAQTPPFTAPAPANTSAPATPPLQSAAIVDLPPPDTTPAPASAYTPPPVGSTEVFVPGQTEPTIVTGYFQNEQGYPTQKVLPPPIEYKEGTIIRPGTSQAV